MKIHLRYLIFLAYFFSLFLLLYLSGDMARTQAHKDFGNTISLVEMPLYFVTYVGYLFLMIYNILIVSSVLFLALAVVSHLRGRREVRVAMVWCLSLNVVLFGICVLMG